ncbi:MAG: hypothetical protein ACXABG_09700 [Promethearchaeota archaeon]
MSKTKQPTKAKEKPKEDKIKWTIWWTPEEHEKFTNVQKATGKRTLAALVRSLVDLADKNPDALEVTGDQDFNEIINELKEAYAESNEENKIYRKSVKENFTRLNRKINLLLEKQNVDKATIQALDGEDTTGEAVFE